MFQQHAGRKRVDGQFDRASLVAGKSSKSRGRDLSLGGWSQLGESATGVISRKRRSRLKGLPRRGGRDRDFLGRWKTRSFVSLPEHRLSLIYVTPTVARQARCYFHPFPADGRNNVLSVYVLYKYIQQFSTSNNCTLVESSISQTHTCLGLRRHVYWPYPQDLYIYKLSR